MRKYSKNQVRALYTPTTFTALLIAQSALGSLLQSLWHRDPDVRKEYYLGVTGRQAAAQVLQVILSYSKTTARLEV